MEEELHQVTQSAPAAAAESTTPLANTPTRIEGPDSDLGGGLPDLPAAAPKAAKAGP